MKDITEENQVTKVEQTEKPKEGQKERKEYPLNPVHVQTEQQFTDEQSINIAQNYLHQAAGLVLAHLNPKNPEAVNAFGSLAMNIAKISQTNIKLRREEEQGGKIAGAAGIVAEMFTKMTELSGKGQLPMTAPHQPDSKGQYLDDEVEVSLAPNETFQGVETLNDEVLHTETEVSSEGDPELFT